MKVQETNLSVLKTEVLTFWGTNKMELKMKKLPIILNGLTGLAEFLRGDNAKEFIEEYKLGTKH